MKVDLVGVLFKFISELLDSYLKQFVTPLQLTVKALERKGI